MAESEQQQDALSVDLRERVRGADKLGENPLQWLQTPAEVESSEAQQEAAIPDGDTDAQDSVLPTDLVIANLDAAKSTLQDWLDRDDVVTLDLSGIERIDGAGAQLLAAVAAHAEANGKSLSLASPSVGVTHAMTTLGLADLLGPQGGTAG